MQKKLLVNNTYGDMTLLILQTKCIIKSVEDETVTKMMERTTNVVVAVVVDV
jgi:hypothetical protein